MKIESSTVRLTSQHAAQEIHFGAGQALTDTPAIDFSGTATTLTSGGYDFDLDADGELEQMPFIGPGGGFLTLDLSGDRAVAEARASSVYLREDGTAGVVHQVHLVAG
jgi:hypothetical protein